MAIGSIGALKASKTKTDASSPLYHAPDTYTVSRMLRPQTGKPSSAAGVASSFMTSPAMVSAAQIKGDYRTFLVVVKYQDSKESFDARHGMVSPESLSSDSKSPKRLSPGLIFVYAFVTSSYMRYPNQDRLWSHMQKLEGKSGTCAVEIHTADRVPSNCLLHLTLTTPMPTIRGDRGVYEEIGRAVIDFSSLSTGKPVDAVVMDVFNRSRDVGKVTVQLSCNTDSDPNSRVLSRYSFPVLDSPIPRPVNEEKNAIVQSYIDLNFAEIWHKYPARVLYPDGSELVASKGSEFINTYDGPLPYLMFFHQASRFGVVGNDSIADVAIASGCLSCKVSVSDLLSKKLSTAVLDSILCHALVNFGRTMGYHDDPRGSGFSEMPASDRLSTAAGVCVEMGAFVAVLFRCIRTSQSAVARAIHPVLARYRLGMAVCTARSGGLVMEKEKDSNSRHLVAMLVPRDPFVSSVSSTRPIAVPLSPTRPLFRVLETMMPAQFAEDLPVAGQTADSEVSDLDYTTLPAAVTTSVLFGEKTRHYGSCYKIFLVDDDESPLYEVTLLQKLPTSGEWVIGVDMRDLLTYRTASAPDMAMLCPCPVGQKDKLVLACHAHALETRYLTNIFYRAPPEPRFDLRRSETALNEKIGQILTSLEPDAKTASEENRALKTGWRIFFAMGPAADAKNGPIQAEIARVEGEIKKGKTKIKTIAVHPVGEFHFLSEVLASCFLMTYKVVV